MCGIVSVFNGEVKYDRNIHVAFSQLLAANTVRGYHSTGLVYGGTYSAEVYKKAVPGYDFVELAVVDRILTAYEEHSFLIGHNRAATRGTISTRNAHPFEHGHITGVHNGTLITYKDLVEGSDPMYAVDSEYIFRGLEQRGAKELIPLINGAYNLLWYDATDNKVHMIRNEDRPYYFAKVKGKDVLFGGSEMGMLSWILNRNSLTIEDVIMPDQMTEYVFDLEGDIMTPQEIKHEEYQYTAPAATNMTANRSNVTQRIPRRIEFTAKEYTPYGNTVPDKGKWTGTSVSGEDVVVYQAADDSMSPGEWYTGLTRTARTEYATYAVDIDSVKLVAADGLRDAVGGEMYRCVGCKGYFPEEELMFCSDAPLCGDCIDHYETIDKEDKICH